MTLIISGDITLRRTWQPMDPDAAAYITAVETADGQALEEKVKIAIDNFVLGCKADGIWDAIKASCILAGARTLNGALVPLVGPVPTNPASVFLSADYDRKTGLDGDGSTKYLNTNFAANQLSPNSNHLFVNGSSFETTGGGYKCAIGAYASTNSRLNMDLRNPSNQRSYRGPDTSQAILSSGLTTSGTVSGSRLSSSLSNLYQDSISVATNTTATSVLALPSATFYVFALNLNGSAVDFTTARFNFFSIGDGLTGPEMSSFHTRVTDLINKFAEVIP